MALDARVERRLSRVSHFLSSDPDVWPTFDTGQPRGSVCLCMTGLEHAPLVAVEMCGRVYLSSRQPSDE